MVDHRDMKYVEVLGSKIAYVDTGGHHKKPVVLFQHGNPTSSYLWRDVIPHVAPHARCIAADLIGFGYSDKPDIAYRVEDHARYFESFIEALSIEDVVLVLHDWGSALGLDWARRHEKRVRGLVLMEFIPPIPTWGDMLPKVAQAFRCFRDPVQGRKMVVDENGFVEQTLPGDVVGGLSEEVMEVYRAPFLDPAHREPVYRFPNELPIAGLPVDVWAMATAYHNWLLGNDVSKLFFWVEPGALIPAERGAWYAEHLRNCRSVALGAGEHFLQENHADIIGQEITQWLLTLR
ncbi:haloalkane dehalogenase (plasmid) [Lichenicola cladoniae]|uniref:Haloalkane dehalogenase n=1 Tax=Lichenicola cladoniae TaxID=1484109 RepID=A0A6M8HZ94_9PROT|nr:haloalkane dehalogenase [Lichenicola cladoniae]NPD69307.1 haloalkane dehalogenase [Acetobacteraceae bacterium]QKE93894.1 haloalkane dehalogenase [Lichenicola cladoniae]